MRNTAEGEGLFYFFQIEASRMVDMYDAEGMQWILAVEFVCPKESLLEDYGTANPHPLYFTLPHRADTRRKQLLSG